MKSLARRDTINTKTDKTDVWQRRNPQNPWFMLGCAWLLGFAMYAPIFCIPPMEHIIKEKLLVSHAQMGLLFTLPLIILAVTAMPSGLLADRIGIRKAAGIGAIVLVVASLMRGTSTNFTTLFGFTCFYGIGYALIYPNMPKLVGTWFQREKAGVATGIYVTGFAIAPSITLAITLPIVYPITNTFQGTIWLWSVPALVAAILWWTVVKEPSLSLAQNQQVDRRDKLSSVLKNWNIWLAGFMLFILNFSFYIWMGWTPALLMLKGAPANLATLIASVISWAGIPFMFLVPWASYKLGLRKPFIWGSAIILALFSWSAIYISVPLFWPLAIIISIPVSGAFSMILALPVEMVPKESVGAASGMTLSIGYTGAFIGPWLAGYILDATGTLNLAIIILIIAAVVWAYIAFIIPETGHRAVCRQWHMTRVKRL